MRRLDRVRYGVTRIAVCVFVSASVTWGHETDQYTVPIGDTMADLGPYFTRKMFDKLSTAVDGTNSRIDRVARSGSLDVLARAQSPEAIASSVFLQFPAVIAQIDLLNFELTSTRLAKQHPGCIVYHRPWNWLYTHGLLALDATKPVRLFRAATVKVNGTYLGTDKFAHFVHMGYLYYGSFQGAIRDGLSQEQAVQRAVGLGAGGDLFLSENGLLGMLSTGVRSNADLAANYMGLQFFRNLTEEVTLQGKRRPPMLIRDGVRWRLADYVQPDSNFFTDLVSDHWDEALNPNTYNAIMAPLIRSAILIRCDALRMWYSDENQHPRPQVWFSQTQDRLQTYHGESYGHAGATGNTIGIANTCFQDGMENSAYQFYAAAGRNDRSEIQRLTAIPKLAESNSNQTPPLLASIDDDNALPAERGATALHAAAATGDAELVGQLLGLGADVDWATQHGATPLHIAHEHAAVVALLLEHGAAIDAKDRFGRTPLFWTARSSGSKAGLVLIQHGADVRIKDFDGETPLHAAVRSGNMDCVSALLSAGADSNAAAAHGIAPIHLAARSGRIRVLNMLLERGARVDLRDDFGWIALHDAASCGDRAITALLVEKNSNVNARDAGGCTPIHIAAHGGHAKAASYLMGVGADRSARNDLGRTPGEVARSNRHFEVADLLQTQSAAALTSHREEGSNK